jgi:hypothetical protein
MAVNSQKAMYVFQENVDPLRVFKKYFYSSFHNRQITVLKLTFEIKVN